MKKKTANPMNRLSRALLPFILAITLASCAHTARAPSTALDTLEQCVHRLWDARQNRDWKTVYTLLDSAFQREVSQDAFVSQGEMAIIEFTLKGIKQTKDHPLEATVETTFTILRMGARFKPTMNETWTYETDRGWVLDKTAMYQKKPF